MKNAFEQNPSAAVLEQAYADGTVMDFGPDEFTGLVASALDADAKLTDEERSGMFDAAVSAYAEASTVSAIEDVSAAFAAVDDSYRSAVAGATAAVSGAGLGAYEAASADDAAGDPSPLLAIEAAYMSNI